MRTHMQLVLQRLGSDKTRTTANEESDADVKTYVFTREATAFLTTHDDDLDGVRPATLDEASSRIQEANIRLQKKTRCTPRLGGRTAAVRLGMSPLPNRTDPREHARNR